MTSSGLFCKGVSLIWRLPVIVLVKLNMRSRHDPPFEIDSVIDVDATSLQRRGILMKFQSALVCQLRNLWLAGNAVDTLPILH